MENIVISDPEGLEEKKKIISRQGAENLVVIGDFGRTFTKCFNEGKKVSTSFAQIRDGGYLGEEYKKQALELFDKYYPIETDPNVDKEERVEKLVEWWKKHMELLVESGLDKKIIEDIIESGAVPLRGEVNEFLEIMYNKSIPLVIVSQGLGDIYIETLRNRDKLSENIFFVTNQFDFDENGKTIGVKDTIINSFNKDRINFEDFEFFDKIESRKNVILLGDDLQDLGMVKNLDYENLIKIGFLNYNIEDNLERYKEEYDVVILNDGTFGYVNKLLKEII